MIRKAVLFAALCVALTGCATRSNPADVAPVSVDPRLCAKLKPEPPVQGGIVEPATDEERVATEQFLTGEAAARQWGRDGWSRAALAARMCK